MNGLSGATWLWIGFSLFIFTMLALDLGLFNRKAHTIRYREAWIWSAVWVTLAMIFASIVFHYQGSQRGFEFLTGYLIELSLSVDNLFVFLLIFSYFKVPSKFQHRVLFWGVMGGLFFLRAVVSRLTWPYRVCASASLWGAWWVLFLCASSSFATGTKAPPPSRPKRARDAG